MKLFKIISVLDYEILSHFNNKKKFCAHTKSSHFAFWWKWFDSLFVMLSQNLMMCVVFILKKNICLKFIENNWLSNQYIRSPRSIFGSFQFLTHAFHCPRDTELIDENYSAENVSIVGQSAVKCIDRFSVIDVHRFWIYPWTMESLYKKWDVRFLRIAAAYRPRYDPKLFVDHSIPQNATSLQNRTIEWPLSNTMFLCKYDDSDIYQTFFFIVFLSQEMSLNTDTNRIFFVKVSERFPQFVQ